MSLALWCVLIAGVMPVVVVSIAKADPKLDNRAPRDAHAQQSGLRRRAFAAHLNGFEAFPFFAAAVLVATTQGGSPSLTDGLAVAWLAVRVAYTLAYVVDRPTARSTAWGIAFFLAIAIFLLPVLS